MNKQNKQIEEIVTVICVSLLLLTTMIVFEKMMNVPFENVTGEVLTTVRIIETRVAYCNFTLEEGLNLVSFFCIRNGAHRTEVIENITNLESIFEYQENAPDRWKSYNPALPWFVVQDLEVMYRTEGYWIRMRAQEDFLTGGGLRLINYINFVPGWNLAGYPTNKTKPVNESFASIEGNFTEVRAYNVSTQVFTNYIPGIGGGLTETNPNRGYWINVSVNEVWVVD
ncbi:MAG: hypothetical protein V1866_00800 [archaeon]